MYLTVFNEFQHKEVLQTVKDTININIDIANTPIDIKSLTDSDRNILYNNAKLMIKPSPIDLTFAKVQERKKEKKEILVEGNNNNNNNNNINNNNNKYDDGIVAEDKVDEVLEALVKLGFIITSRKPVTSAGCPMTDRVILKYNGDKNN
eukprot:Tbor_TRINITY_DN5551_c4_g3::TRINITY_DN5551_c4_g3_i3::g.12746::m.12746